MRKLAFLSVAFALVAVSFYGCDETNPIEPEARGASNGNDAGPEGSLAAASFASYPETTSSTGVPMVILGDPDWPDDSYGRAINERGDVAGTCTPRELQEACVWTSKGLIMLPQPDPRVVNETYARAINNRGQIVGWWSALSWWEPAVLWEK